MLQGTTCLQNYLEYWVLKYMEVQFGLWQKVTEKVFLLSNKMENWKQDFTFDDADYVSTIAIVKHNCKIRPYRNGANKYKIALGISKYIVLFL